MTYDIIIIGGGINGAGIAADAASRGLSVLLAEQYEFGSGTSSKSSKLIHGGLRYLEYGEIRLVRKALKERKTLLKTHPDLVHPLKFIIPKASWYFRLGLWCYDLLSWGDQLPRSATVKITRDFGLHSQYKTGLSYYDAQTNDHQLVLATIKRAQQHGAITLEHHECIHTKKQENHWEATLKDAQGNTQVHQANIVVNATGPWLHQTHKNLRLVKGSHLLVKKLYSQEHAYLLPQPDGRIVFVMPYEGNTLIGTTEVPYEGDPHEAKISAEEIDYLTQAIQRYFTIAITEIIEGFAGVRPLFSQKNAKMSAMSRDYHLEFENNYLTVFGGKLTTFRILAEEAVNVLTQ
jgi:glycerol-3-phosphate dehydrogenase